MNAEQIAHAIRSGTFTITELDLILGAVKDARSAIAQQNLRKVRVGAAVVFTDPRKGTTHHGTIRHINRKTVTLAPTTEFLYGVRVPLSWIKLA